jgi:hypothetical protein
MGGYWDPEVGIVAAIILAGMELACSSANPATRSLAAPFAIAGGLLLVGIIVRILLGGE